MRQRQERTFPNSPKSIPMIHTAKEGGDLGIFKKGDMLPDIEKTLTTMKAGEVSSLVRTSAGIHIIKLVEFVEGTKQSFDSVKGEVEDHCISRSRKNASASGLKVCIKMQP